VAQHVSLRELERKAWTSLFQDGLWDIFLGLLLASSAVNAWLSDTGAPSTTRIPTYMAIIVLGGLALWVGKRFITMPRMGYVRFGPRRRARLNRLRAVILLSVLVIAALFLAGLGMQNHWLGRPEWWLIGRIPMASAMVTLNFLVVFSLMAYLMDFSRLYLYGVLFALQEVLGVALRELAGVDIGFLVGSALSAAIVLLMGIVVFVRFLGEYPLPAVGSGTDDGYCRQ